MQSMEEIYKLYAQTVYRFLLSLTHDSSLSEELTQETFYQAVKCSDKFDKSCKITTWLCAIAKNQLRAYQRKNRDYLKDDFEEFVNTASSAETDALANISRIEILKRIHKLDEPIREVLYLRLFGDLSFREIGDILGRTENWARVNYYRGKEKLVKEIKENE